MLIKEDMDIKDKLKILADSAKYDAACTSSGSDRRGSATGIGSTVSSGICHSFAADGRCISLLKRYCLPMNVFMTADTASTAAPTMCSEPHLPRKRYAHSPWSFTGVII